jgi:hypothetical protein
MFMPGQLVSPALLASATGAVGRSGPGLARMMLVAVIAVGAFAVLWVLAWSRRRSPVAGYRRLGDAYDWRTLPPKDESDAMAVEDAEEYGPLWRYGVPLGYGRVYHAGHDRGYDPS